MKQLGFTLIELLVVITIISLLAVALLPQVIGSTVTASKLADEQNLRFHYTAFQMYQTRYKRRLPRGGGHKFILDPWIRNVVEHTDQNRDRYFSPMVQGDDRQAELQDMDATEIWKDRESLSSEDTHYAGRARAHKQGMVTGKAIWMATDNEFGPIYADGTIIILKGDGSTSQLNPDPDLIKYGYPEDPDEEFTFVVGPDSPHPGLAKLEK